MNPMLISTALTAFLWVQAPATIPQTSSGLAELREQSANAIQPPEQVMDLIGIRAGLVIGEVGAGRGRVTVYLAARVGDGKDFLRSLRLRQGAVGPGRHDPVLGAHRGPRLPFALEKSIRPGGYVVFEHVVQRADNPFPPGIHAPAPGALRELFRDFEILIYREVDDYGD